MHGGIIEETTEYAKLGIHTLWAQINTLPKWTY